MSAGKKTENMRGIVWDLDNTLYRVDELMEDAFNIAVARAAVAAGAPLTMPAAVDMARRGWREHGYSGHLFIRDFNLGRDELHEGFHGFLDETIIKKSHEVRACFESLPVDHALVTHSHRGWARRVLAHLGLAEWFAEERILGLEDYGFRHKHACRSSFQQALGILALEAEQAFMVEDTLHNLKFPHEMGMTTVFIHHGRLPGEMPDYVDLSFGGAADFLRWFRGKV